MKRTKIYQLVLIIILTFNISFVDAQLLTNKIKNTHSDSLRGEYGAGRDWWDVTNYDVHVKFSISDSFISGYNDITFKVLKNGKYLQLDLQDPLILDSIIFYSNALLLKKISDKYIVKDGNAYIVSTNLFNSLSVNSSNIHLLVYYHGKPIIANRPPWDGGLIMKKDKNNNPWVSIACQGLGASVWYPCKDHQSDEPDKASLWITSPDSLITVANGRLIEVKNNNDGTNTSHWAVNSPINNYTLIPSIGKYVHFSEVYKGEKGDLDMDYWVLDYNLEKAKKHFIDATRMMKAFEYWFGPYPFYKDGYKLVESSHLGMEHQSAVAYGNGFKYGYLGRDLSGTGWGLKWDFIIVHESGHEWFGNNITTKDIADMWVHEGFTNYSETLFTEFYYGKEAASAYIIGIRKNILNDKPIIGPYNVNKEGSGDMYPKAANMIHTIRQIINDDLLFRKIVRGLNSTFYHQTVTSKQVENYISVQSKINFNKIFDQYLRNIQIPILEYRIEKNMLYYRFTNCINGFEMPIKALGLINQWINATEKWQLAKLSPNINSVFLIFPNFYIKTKEVD
jgi:aminopeptidase N